MSRISPAVFQKVIPELGVPRLAVVQGPAGSGKTAWLMGRVAKAVEKGDVLVVCASRIAADDFASRVAAACADDAAKKVRCVTPFELACEVLGAGEGGRRVLLPYECEYLMPDMARLAIRPERLEQIVSFFKRSWADLTDWNPAWLVTHEERDLTEAIDAWQERMGGRLYERVVPDALALVRDDTAIRASLGAVTVVVDDFQLLSRAEQVLCVYCAKAELVVANDPAGATQLFNEAFYEAGIDELLEQNPEAEVVSLDVESEAEAEAEAAGGSSSDDPYQRDRARLVLLDSRAEGRVLAESDIRVMPSASEEFDAVADQVAAWLQAGLKPADIVVVAEHPTWRPNVGVALKGICEAESLPALKFGEYGSKAFVERSRALALMRLIACPSDAMAARIWGYDVPADFAHGYKGENLVNAVALAIAGTAADERVIARVAGFLKEACAPVTGCSATEMVANLQKNLLAPRFLKQGAVRICSLEQSWGLEPKACILAGCMEGFLPAKSVLETTLLPGNVRERIFKSEVEAVKALKASEKFVCLATGELPLATADALGLEPARIVARDGERIAVLKPASL